MSVFVSIEDREGESLSEVYSLERLQRHFKAIEASVCARFISEEDDAVFNQAQLPVLEAEFRTLEAKGLKAEEAGELKRLLEFCGRARKKRNALLKFYGEGEEDKNG
jgi:hypothetical protein